MENLPRNTSAVISAAAVIVIIYGMQAAKVLLVPFLLAVFLALISVKPMLWLQSKRVPSVLAALLIVTAMMLIIGLVGTIVGTSIAEFTAALPAYQARLTTLVAETTAWVYDLMGEDPEQVPNALRDVLTNTFLILFTIVFILLEASGIGVKAQAAFGRRAKAFANAQQFLDNLGRYLGIKTMVSFATGFLAWVVTRSVGVDFPLLWGMLAFLFNYVPTIGSIIAALPPVLLALIQLGPGEATTTMIGYMGINIAFGNFIEPRMMGYGVGISPLIVFTGLVLWGWIFGPVGMLLSVPLTMALKMGLESNDDTRWIAILIGSERDAEYALALHASDDENEQ